MSCEDELANLMNAQENLRYQKTECDNIAISQGTDSSAYLQCRGLLGGAEGALDRAYEAYATCVAKAKAARFLYSTGHVLLLRVAEPSHNAWGGGETNKIRAEVVFKLDSLPVKSFGFPLTNDASGPARQGMLRSVRDFARKEWPLRGSTTSRSAIADRRSPERWDISRWPRPLAPKRDEDLRRPPS